VTFQKHTFDERNGENSTTFQTNDLHSLPFRPSPSLQPTYLTTLPITSNIYQHHPHNQRPYTPTQEMAAHGDSHGGSHGDLRMASPTLDSLIAAASASAAPDELSSAHGHGGGGGMSMVFATNYKTPVLWPSLAPSSTAQAFGLGVGIFLLAFGYRCLLFLRVYLEDAYWSPKAHAEFPSLSGSLHSSSEKSMRQRGIAQEFKLSRDVGRMLAAGVTSVVGYTLMLIVMTMVVVSSTPTHTSTPRMINADGSGGRNSRGSPLSLLGWRWASLRLPA